MRRGGAQKGKACRLAATDPAHGGRASHRATSLSSVRGDWGRRASCPMFSWPALVSTSEKAQSTSSHWAPAGWAALARMCGQIIGSWIADETLRTPKTIPAIPGGQGCHGPHRPHIISALPGFAAPTRCWRGRRPWGTRRHSGPPSSEITGSPTPLMSPAQALFPGPRRVQGPQRLDTTESASSEVSLCPPNSILWINSTAHHPDSRPWPSLNITPTPPSPSLSGDRHSFNTTRPLLSRRHRHKPRLSTSSHA